MARATFDQELQRLRDEVMILGSMVEESLTQSVQALKNRDFIGSRRIIAGDRFINEKRYAIEAEAMTLIATQQPMAGDMRFLAAVLEISSELERMGDYGKGIARINLMIGEQPLMKPLLDLPIMAKKACAMLREALRAFMEENVELARAIPEEDNEIDKLYEQVYRELITYILEDPRNIEQANLLLWVAHNLERVADRVINLCERTVFMATGEIMELGSDDTGIESIN